ncbi:hypothetical protein K438DRAFT_1617247, partial [Mycena galopus ATCC 62051]
MLPRTQIPAIPPNFFAALTIEETRGINLPHILEKNSLGGFVFTPDAPTLIAEIAVTAGEAVPCLDDLLCITQGLEEAYNHGARAVIITVGNELKNYYFSKVRSDSQKKSNLFLNLFSKIRLLMNINNQALPLMWAAATLDRVVSSSLLLPAIINEFKQCKYSEPLAGFHVTETPLYNIGCLLGEQWAMEDILNARAELTYFR